MTLVVPAGPVVAGSPCAVSQPSHSGRVRLGERLSRELPESPDLIAVFLILFFPVFLFFNLLIKRISSDGLW